MARTGPARTFLSTLQLADSFFPSGSVSFSYGLEAFAAETGIRGKEAVRALLADYLRGKMGPTDVVAVANAHRAAKARDLAQLVWVDGLVSAISPVAEFREGSRKMGRGTLATVKRLVKAPFLLEYEGALARGETPGHYAVVFGLACALLGISLERAVLMSLYTFQVSFLGAAVRLNLLGHQAVQEILAELQGLTAELAREHQGKAASEMRSFAPLIDIMGMRHPHLKARLFAS